MVNLMGLHREGILAETEVSAFRSHLLETLIASPLEQEQPVILRDKLLFLQELLYAKCISADEYHSSKRPLLQRLAVQGAEIEARDVIVAGPRDPKENSDEEWSVIDLKDENCLLNKENSNSKNKSKHGSAIKQIKGAASVFGFHKPGKNKEEKSIFDSASVHLGSTESKFTSPASAKSEMWQSKENPFWDSHLKQKESDSKSILMPESLPQESVKRKPFKTLFQKEQREGHGGGGGGGDHNCPGSEEKAAKSVKKQWGFEGLKKWKKNDSEDETAPLPLNERSDSEAYMESGRLVASPIGQGPNTKLIKKKLHSDGSPSDFFIDKVLGDKIKKELSRIQKELCTTNPNLQFSNDQMEAISTQLPVDKADLKKFFPKSWCDRYGDVVLDVVKKEFKDHVGEMENMRNATREKHNSNSTQWTTFEDDENCHPNLFSHHDNPFSSNSNSSKGFQNNPFFHDYTESNGNKLRTESAIFQDQNPFWTPRHGSSYI